MSDRSQQVTVSGINGLVRALRKAQDQDALAVMKRTGLDAAGLVHAAAAPLVPIRSGRLLRTLRGGATPRGGIVRAGTKAVPWAGPIHFGWPARNISPNTFLYTAADQRRDEVRALYATRIGELADRLNRPHPD